MVRELAAYGLRQVDLGGEPLSVVHWDEFLRLCEAHRLTGQLTLAIDGAALAVDGPRRDEALTLCRRWTLQSMLVDQTLCMVDSMLGGVIDFQVLKGPVYARSIYPPGLVRAYVDVDLLVRRDSFGACVDRLTEGGCRLRDPSADVSYAAEFGKGLTLVAPGGVRVDLHCAYAAGPLSHRIPLSIDPAEGLVIEVDGHRLAAISRPLAIIHTAVTVVLADYPARFGAYADFAWLCGGPQTTDALSAAVGLAREWRLEWIVREAAAATSSLLGTDTMTEETTWRSSSHRESVERRYMHAIYRSAHRRWRRQTLGGLPYVPGLRAKFRYLLASARASDTDG